MRSLEEIKLEWTKIKSVISDKIKNLFSLRYLLFAIGGTSVFSAFLISGYCHRYGLPFFEIVDQLSKYLIYINLFSLFFMILVFGFFMAPAIAIETYEKSLPTKIFYSIPKLRKFKFKAFSNRMKEIVIFSFPRVIYGSLWVMIGHYLFLLVMVAENNTTFYWMSLLFYTIPLMFTVYFYRINVKFMEKRFIKLERLGKFEDEGSIQNARNFVLTIDTVNWVLMCISYFFWMLYAFKSRYEEAMNNFVVLGPMYIILIFLCMSAIRIRVFSSIMGASAAIVIIFSFFWPGLGSVLRIVFLNLYVGGDIPVVIYIKDEYKHTISQNMFLQEKDKYEKAYNNPLKPLSLILWGTKRVYLHNNNLRDCEILSDYIQSKNKNYTQDCRTLLTLDVDAIAGVSTFKKRE